MADIFISYSHKDQNYVQELTGYLTNKGFSVWVDERIDHGDRWWQTIVSNIRKCAAMVVVMTPDSEKTDWVEREYFFADRNKKPIFPLLLGGECFPFFVNRHYSDVRDRSMPPNALLGTLKQFVEQANEERNRKEEEQKRIEAARKAEEERKEKEAETKRKADEEKLLKDKEELKRKAEEDKRRKEREEQERKAAEEKRRKEQELRKKAEKERLKKETEAKRKTEEVRKRKEIEEQRKIEEERKREEERQKRVEAGLRAEEKHEHKDAGAKPKLGAEKLSEPKLTEQIAPEPRKRGKTLKISAAGVVVVLLFVGIWWWARQQVNEIQQELEKLDRQALNLENAVSELNKADQIEELTRQKDTLNSQFAALSERATKVGLESQLAKLKDRLKQVQIQLANRATEFKEKEFIKVRQTMDKLDRQASSLENAVAKLDKPEQIEEFGKQKDALSRQVEGFVEKATKVGMGPQLEQLQNRLEQIQVQLAKKEKELIAARKGKIFVASAPDNATVKILNINQPFQQGMELEPGKYHVEVSSKGFEPQERSIELGAGEEKRISFELEKIAPRIVRLFVDIVPEGATVKILNIKPKFVQGMELEPGSYHMEVAADGYGTERQWIDLEVGQKQPIRFELAKKKIAEPASRGAPREREKELGLRVMDITPELSKRYKIWDKMRGVVVAGVVPGSKGANAGFQVGDIIKEINRQTIERVRDYSGAMQKTKSGEPVILLIWRKNAGFLVFKMAR